MNGRNRKMVTALIASGVTLALLAAAAESATTTGGSYKLVGAFGKTGTGSGQFTGARGIAVAPNGNLYIADQNNARISVFSSRGVYKSKWGSVGSENGQFSGARDVAISPNGTIWVADDTNARAQAFTATGGWKSAVSIGNESARGVAVDAEGNVYVASEGGERAGFRVFSGGNDSTTDLLGAGNFSPQDIEVSPDGTVFLATAASNAGDSKVRHFTKDGKSLGIFPLTVQSSIGVDLDCNVWASDFFNRGIAKYSPTGKRLATATYPDLQAQDIAVAKNGDIYVTQLNGPIVHFAENRSKPATAAIPGRLTVSKGPAVRVAYALRGIACPAVIGATATLTGPGISGTAAGLKLKAGKTNVITVPLVARSLKTAPATGKATFKITLQTNGRPTVETRTVTVVVPASVR
jgi:sugar lactone lactonase YvrE